MADISAQATGAAQAAAAAMARETEQTEPASGERAKRIRELRRQCQDGTYSVDAAAVSKQIIEKHLGK